MPPTLHVSSHPAILHKLAVLRNVKTEPKKFREVVRELSWLLGYEALADVGVRPLKVQTPIEEMEGAELAGLHLLHRGLDRERLRLGVLERLVAEQPADLTHELAEELRIRFFVAHPGELVEDRRMGRDVERRKLGLGILHRAEL